MMRMSTTSKKGRKGRIALACFVVGALGALAPSAASAAYSFSSEGHYTAAGWTWTNQALVQTVNSSFVQANTQTYTSTSQTGISGSRGRLFTGYAPSGPMSCEGNNVFNSGNAFASAWSCNRYSSNSWWSWGVSLAWTGSGYQSFYTFKTTSVNL